jgi:hypothetical protein
MSRIYDALKKLEVERGSTPPVPPPAFLDAVRLEQFLELQRELLLLPDQPDVLPDRLVQAVAVFLGAGGAAIGVVRNGVYRILATYGLSLEWRTQYDGSPVAESRIAAAFTSGRPLMLARDAVLPFGGERGGALHVIGREGSALRDGDIPQARALAVLVGVALANAGICPRTAERSQ